MLWEEGKLGEIVKSIVSIESFEKSLWSPLAVEHISRR